MVTYTIDKRPKRLRLDDKVIFSGSWGTFKYVVMDGTWLVCAGPLDGIFGALGLTQEAKELLAERCFGYTPTNSYGWPSSKPKDYAAHCRLVNALYDLIEEREKGNPVPPDEPKEPGIFLGYDWAPCNEPLGTSTELNESGHESIDAACDDAAARGYDACLVFKLYAVDAKKYTRKFVLED